QHAVLVPLEGVPRLAGLRVPDDHVLVLAPGDEGLAVAAVVHALDGRLVALEGAGRLAGRAVPDADLADPGLLVLDPRAGRGGEALAVGGDREPLDLLRVVLQEQQFLAGVGVPHADGAVAASGGEALAGVKVEDARDEAGVPLEFPQRLVAVLLLLLLGLDLVLIVLLVLVLLI